MYLRSTVASGAVVIPAGRDLGLTAAARAAGLRPVAVLVDPARHEAIDGTGGVRESLDSKPLTAAGQVFRMAMYHAGHPDGNYQVAIRVPKFDPPCVISWELGHYAGSTRAVSCRGVEFADDLRRSRELPPQFGLPIPGLEPSLVSAGDGLTSSSMNG